MSKSHFSPGRIKKIAQGKVNYVILCGDLECYSSNNFLDAVQFLDFLQRQHPILEYKFTVKELE